MRARTASRRTTCSNSCTGATPAPSIRATATRAWRPAPTTSTRSGSTTPRARARWWSRSRAPRSARPSARSRACRTSRPGTAEPRRDRSMDYGNTCLTAPTDLLASYRIDREPFYRPAGNEVALYEQASRHRMPLILKGPTGCGKTRFVEHMAWSLGRPLVTLACNEDMTASDLVGRYLLDANGTAWHDGPLTLAVRHGGICYLDE